jgi:hypothetical protein
MMVKMRAGMPEKITAARGSPAREYAAAERKEV